MSSQLQIPFDLSRGRRNPNSRAAYQRVQVVTDQAKVMGLLESRGEKGLTLKEAVAVFGCEKNEISGRFSELKKLGKIEQIPERRLGCGIWKCK